MENHARVVQHVAVEIAIGREAGVVPVVDVVARYRVASLVGTLAVAPRFHISPACQKFVSKIRGGTDPLNARQAHKQALVVAAQKAEEKLIAFREAALATVEAKRGGWSNPKHAAQWLATLEQHAFPSMGEMPVAQIDLAAVLRVLRPIWPVIPETASRLRQRIEAILDLARVRGWRSGENPALARPAL
jgi:hypothetical protein